MPEHTFEELTGCARCGETHRGLVFKPLTQTSKLGEMLMTHWAPCPTNGEPVMLLRGPKQVSA